VPTKPKAPDASEPVAKARASQPVIPKPKPATAPPVAPVPAPAAAPAKAKPVEPRSKLPADWKKLVGTPLSCTWRRSAGHMIEVIDWAKFPDRETWLADVFGDCDLSKHFTGLIARKHDRLEWVSGSMLPVALLGQQHGGDGQLEAILLIDTTVPDSPIYAIEVDGTAIPAKKIEPVKPEAKAEARKAPSFETFRPAIASGKMTGDARKLMAKLSGDKDGGASYLHDYVKKKPKPPEGRDPRWIEALRDELAKSMVFASTAGQSETFSFAGTLASFGAPAVPALVAAFETALKSYPKKSLGYGVKPVLDALDYLASDAGVPLALAIIERADKPDKSWAIGPALEYLAKRTDDRIPPVIKKLRRKVGPKQAPQFQDELTALAEKLGVD
jgi:hypothetical protein